MKNFICRFVGGPKQGMMNYEEAVASCNGFSEDLTEQRKRGAWVHRAELDNQPTFNGYLGPMWDGTMNINGVEHGVLRYETQEVYNMLSMD